LIPTGRELIPKYRAVGEVISEKIEARSCLLVAHPEDDREEEQHHDRCDRLLLLRLQEGEEQPGDEDDQCAQHEPHLVSDYRFRAEVRKITAALVAAINNTPTSALRRVSAEVCRGGL